jgi:hypothetical protein
MATKATTQQTVPTPDAAALEPAPTGLEDLSRRVAELERRVEGVLSGRVAEVSQEERDRLILARRPNNYPEAVEFEAARARQAERDEKRPKGERDEVEDPAKAQPSTPPSNQPPAPVAR